MSNEVDSLSKFGLSVDEAAIFYVLTRVRKSGHEWISGKELAFLARKDRVRVYQILQRLSELGLVRTNFARPKEYSAVSPQTALHRLMAIHESKLNQLNREELATIEMLTNAEPLQININEERRREIKSAITVLQGLPNIQHALRTAMADQIVRLIMNEQSADHILSLIKFSAERPRSGQIIFSGNHNSRAIRDYSDILEECALESISLSSGLPSFVLTENEMLLLFYPSEPQKAKSSAASQITSEISHILIVSDKAYVMQAQGLYGILWENATRERTAWLKQAT